jgi:uncharacterized membrane protein YqiK
VALTVLFAVGALGLMLCGWLAVFALCFKKAAPDEALVITRASADRRVSFTSSMVFPVMHQLSRVSLREHVLGIDCHGDQALRTRDDRAVELVATFCLRVGRKQDDVLRALTAMGEKNGDLEALRERFVPTLRGALEEVARRTDAAALDGDRGRFKDEVLTVVGRDLDGYELEDVAITGVKVGAGSAYRG